MGCDKMGICQEFPGVTLQMTGMQLRWLARIPSSLLSWTEKWLVALSDNFTLNGNIES